MLSGRYWAAEDVEMDERRRVSEEEAQIIGDDLGIHWDRFTVEQFRRGMEEELRTTVTNDDLRFAGRMALARLKEDSGYYDRSRKGEERPGAGGRSAEVR